MSVNKAKIDVTGKTEGGGSSVMAKLLHLKWCDLPLHM